MVSSPHDLIQYVHSNCLFVQKKAPQDLHLRDKEKSIFESFTDKHNMKRHMKYVHEREELRSVTFVKIVLFCSTDERII